MKTLIILTLHIVIFFTRPDCVMNAIVPFKAVRIKNNASEWFDGETAGKMHTRDKLYKKFKSTKLHVDEEIYKEARNTIQNLILKKKKENTANPKKLQKTLKQLGLPEKRLPCNELKFDSFTTSELFKKPHCNLANDFVQMLPVALRKFDMEAEKTI